MPELSTKSQPKVHWFMVAYPTASSESDLDEVDCRIGRRHHLTDRAGGIVVALFLNAGIVIVRSLEAKWHNDINRVILGGYGWKNQKEDVVHI